MGKQAPICNLFIHQAWWHKILSSQWISIKHGWPSEEHYTQSDNARDFLLEKKPRFVGFNKYHWIAIAKEQKAKQKSYNRSQDLEPWKVICLFPATWNLEIRWIFDEPFLFRDGECHWMKEEVPVCFWERLVYFGSFYLVPSRLLKFALKRKQFQILPTNNICCFNPLRPAL